MKQIMERISLILFGCMLALGIGELLTRLTFPAPEKIVVKNITDVDNSVEIEKSSKSPFLSKGHSRKDGLQIFAQTGRLTLSHICFSDNMNRLYIGTQTGRRLRANTHVIIENHYIRKCRTEIKTNSLGYRNREIKNKKKTRILFLGDSITFGHLLQEEETFVRLVETISDHYGEDWETINAGLGGIGLENELTILEETGFSLEPDIVVLDFYLNDFQESPAIYVRKLPALLNKSRILQYLYERLSLKWDKSQLHRHIFRSESYQGIRAWQKDFKKNSPMSDGDYRLNKSAFNILIYKHFLDWGGSWSCHAWEDMEPIFVEFKRLSTTHKFKLIIIVFPVCYQIEADFLYDYPQKQLHLIAERLDIPVLNILPILRKECQESNEKLFYDQCHPTPYANEVIARKIFHFLRKILEQPNQNQESRESEKSLASYMHKHFYYKNL